VKDYEKLYRLTKTVDTIRDRFGDSSLLRARLYDEPDPGEDKPK
jgi:hypothetical protein